MDKIYVLTVIDEGLIKAQIARKALLDLFTVAYETILSAVDQTEEEGNLYTEDGYANISELDLTGENDEKVVWNFSFDGESNLADNIGDEQTAALQKTFNPEAMRILVERDIYLKKVFNDFKQYDNALEIVFNSNVLEGIEYQDQYLEILKTLNA